MKVILTIAGSDSSGGAGIQADIKTAEYFGVFASSAITAITAQNSCGVIGVLDVAPEFIKKQIKAVMSDFEISTIKIGMLSNKTVINLVYELIRDIKIPVVLDPVFISKAGSPLMSDEVIEEIKKLFNFTTIITPNLFEAKKLFGQNLQINNSTNVLITKIKEDDKSIDRLFYKDGGSRDFSRNFIETNNLHGTGCTFSTALAANIALGKSIEEAIEISKEYVYQAIKNAPNLGHGKGPIRHNLRVI